VFSDAAVDPGAMMIILLNVCITDVAVMLSGPHLSDTDHAKLIEANAFRVHIVVVDLIIFCGSRKG